MAFDIQMKLVGKLPDFDKSKKVFKEAAREAVTEVLQMLRREVQRRTPVGVTRELRGSWFTELRGTPVDIHGVLANPMEYAIPIEEGTKPHWPPRDPLELWVKRKLGLTDESEIRSVAFLIQRKIGRKGTRAVHMLENTLKDSRGRVDKIFDRTGLKIESNF